MKRILESFGRIVLLEILLWPGVSVHAETITLAPVDDTRLSEQSRDTNEGTAIEFVAGTQGSTAVFARNRALVRFDPSASVPANAMITSVQLTVTVTKASNNGTNSQGFDLRRMLRGWKEIEATWNLRQLPDRTWVEPGGKAGVDFSTVISASTGIAGTNNPTAIFDSTPDLVADVQAWVEDPASNFGWMLLVHQEETPQTARRIASRENTTIPPPALEIQYILRPRIDSFRIDGDMFTFQFAADAPFDYAVEFRESFSAAEWQALTNFTAKIGSFDAVASDLLSAGAHRFYRVKKTPCLCR